MSAEVSGFPGLLRSTVAKHPDAIGLVDGDRRITWQELSDLVDRASANLRDAGIAPGDDVALIGGNSIEFVSGLLGALACGAAVATLNPATTEAEIAKYVSPEMTSLIVINDDMAANVGGAVEGTALQLLKMTDMLRGDGPVEAPILQHPGDTAVYGYSSGSTGKPKRVGRTHANFMAEAVASARATGISHDDVVLAVAPIFHSHGLVNGLLSALQGGARLVLIDGLQRGAILTAVETEGVTVMPSVPFVYQALAENKRTRALDWSSVRIPLVAGAALARDTYELFKEATGTQIRQGYGSTEAGLISVNMDDDVDEAWDSVGPPTGSVELKIVDEETGATLGPGEIGEIRLRGDALTDGYGVPELDAEAFVDGWFRSGDLGRQDEQGRIVLTGRTKLYISTSGYKVDPFEVEQVIAGHPGVVEVVVVGVKGSAEEVVKAVVVPRSSLDRKDIVGACRGTLADYKIPRIVEFRDEIPRSPIGKILRSELI